MTTPGKAAEDLLLELRTRSPESRAQYLRTITHAEAMRGLLERFAAIEDNCYCELCEQARALLAQIDGGSNDH